METQRFQISGRINTCNERLPSSQMLNPMHNDPCLRLHRSSDKNQPINWSLQVLQAFGQILLMFRHVLLVEWLIDHHPCCAHVSSVAKD